MCAGQKCCWNTNSHIHRSTPEHSCILCGSACVTESRSRRWHTTLCGILSLGDTRRLASAHLLQVIKIFAIDVSLDTLISERTPNERRPIYMCSSIDSSCLRALSVIYNVCFFLVSVASFCVVPIFVCPVRLFVPVRSSGAAPHYLGRLSRSCRTERSKLRICV